MSYETNPILTRLKINKGWKNPFFPTKSLNYSYEILVWFKIYLLLKAYFALHEIKLLNCEMKASEHQIKILFLSVVKQIKIKKNFKSKWKAKSALRNLQSPFLNSQNQKARFLLYLDYKTLQKKSNFSLNQWQKKTISKAWISKPRLFSWINLSTLIHKYRLKTKHIHHFNWRFKKNFFGQIKTDSIKTSKPYFKQNVKYIYQKKLKIILTKTRKKIWFLKKSLRVLAKYKTRYFKEQTPAFQLLFSQLTNEHKSKMHFLKKINLWSQTLILITNKEKITSTLKNHFRQKTKKKIERIIFQNFLLNFKKQVSLFQKQPLFFWQKSQFITLYREILFKKTNPYIFFLGLPYPYLKHFLEKLYVLKFQKLFWKFLWTQKAVVKPKFNISKKSNFNAKLVLQKTWSKKTSVLTKIRSFKRRTIPFTLSLVKFIRLRQKSKVIDLLKSQVKIKKKRTHKYRLPYRYHYKTKIAFLTHFKFKYVIQDFIQKYFATHVYVKILWPLTELKNLKFYRLAFSKQKSRLTFNTQWFPKKLSLQKRYIFIGYATKHIQLNTKTAAFQKKIMIHKQIVKHKPRISLKAYKKKNEKPKNKQQTLQIFSSLWRKNILKKNKYLIQKKQLIQQQTQQRWHWIKKNSYMLNLLPTLTLFAKYLDPQPLADDLAKILGETKKHSSTLRFIERILSRVKLKRGIGYRIALIGRADGANKSRTIYLRKLNRNWSRQSFSNNVNFGFSQARATIGAFGVKIWVYF